MGEVVRIGGGLPCRKLRKASEAGCWRRLLNQEDVLLSHLCECERDMTMFRDRDEPCGRDNRPRGPKGIREDGHQDTKLLFGQGGGHSFNSQRKRTVNEAQFN